MRCSAAMQASTPGDDSEALREAIAALEAQRELLGQRVVETALAPLRERLQTLQRPMGLQRRLMTVLFADLVGSTALVRRLDAEDALVVMGGLIERMAHIVAAHQGRVLQFAGDGLKAVFGAEQAREDDAERALRAGLAMLDAARTHAAALPSRLGVPDLVLRLGAHTGLVVIGAGYEDCRTAVGETVHLAARMEQHAPPGSFRISAETWAHVRGQFELEPQPALQVKGIELPLTTYLVRAQRPGRRDRPERGIPGQRLSMVGRGDELARLRALVAAADRSGRVQLCLLEGEAGLGKSRLLRELVAELPTRRVHVARAQADGAMQPWGLLRQMLAAGCGITDTDPAALARRRLVTTLRRAFGPDSEAVAHRLGHLVGLDFDTSPHLAGRDPRALRDLAFAAVGWLLRALFARDGHPVLLLLEDLHWADEGSLDLLRHLAGQAAQAPCVLLSSSRPGLQALAPELMALGEHLGLQPLSAVQTEALARTLLGRLEAVPEPLLARLVEQSEGNPYYLEELVRRLIDDGAIAVDAAGAWTMCPERLDTLRLPATLVGLLQARLDALAPPARRTAEGAAIVGHVFWDAAVAGIEPQAREALPVLAQSAVVRRHAHSRVDGAAEWSFGHHLLHQVTYETIPQARRSLGHAAVMRWMLAQSRARSAEFLALTAAHAERADRLPVAVECYTQAAAAARRRYANRLAIDCTERAQRLLSDIRGADPTRRSRLLEQLVELADTVGDRELQRRTLDEWAACLAEHTDPVAEAAHAISSAMLADRTGDHAGAGREAERAVSLAGRAGAGADAHAALAHAELCWLHGLRGEHASARAHQLLGAALAERLRDTQPLLAVQLRLMAGIVELRAGAFLEARALLEDARTRVQALGERRTLIGVLDHLCALHTHIGDNDAAWQCAQAFVANARDIGAEPRVGHGLMQLAYAARMLGRNEEARQAADEAVAIARRAGERWTTARALAELAQAWESLGQPDAARRLRADAESLFSGVDPAAPQCLAQAALGAWEDMQCGRSALARDAVEHVLAALDAGADLSGTDQSVEAGWACCRVLRALGDPRGEALHAALRAEVQGVARELTAAGGDGQRLLAAVPVYREVLAGHDPAAASD